MFTLEDWPTTTAPNVHWYPCQHCGDWFFRITLTDDPKSNLHCIYTVCWSQFNMLCETCDHQRRQQVEASQAKHPAFRSYLGKFGGAK